MFMSKEMSYLEILLVGCEQDVSNTNCCFVGELPGDQVGAQGCDQGHVSKKRFAACGRCCSSGSMQQLLAISHQGGALAARVHSDPLH